MSSEEIDVSVSKVKLPTVSIAILIAAFISTVIWLLNAYDLANSPVPPDAKPLTLNEWGDFIAGVSAPVAFVWLVVAVALQSIELREQRKELAYTRAEFVSNRAVMKEQANEAKRQAEFIEQQTKLLVSEQTDRQAQAIFDASIDLISTRLRQYQSAWHVMVITRHEEQGEPYGDELILRSGKFSQVDDRFIIPKSVQAIRTELRKLREDFPDNPMHVRYPYDFNRLYVGVITGLNRILVLPDSFRIMAETLELDELREQLIYISKRAGIKPFDNVSNEDVL